MQDVIQGLEQWKSQLEEERTMLTREIDSKIKKINELILAAKQENQQGLKLYSISKASELRLDPELMLWEVIKTVLNHNPEKWWRGSDLTKELIRLGYRQEKDYVSLGQRVSSTLKWYSEDKHARPSELEIKRERDIPYYRPLKKAA